jgi:hypothetical protein
MWSNLTSYVYLGSEITGRQLDIFRQTKSSSDLSDGAGTRGPHVEHPV